MSMVVYDETGSTTLSAIFMIASSLPSILLPFVIGPIVDRKDPLKILLKNEMVLAGIFFASGIYINFLGFNYLFFMALSLVISALGIISNIASGSIIPQVLDKKNYIKGNAALNTIYPLMNIAVVPIATILFQKYGIGIILIGYSVLTVLDVLVESRIDVDFKYDDSSEKFSLSEFKADLRDGYKYFNENTAIKYVFIFFSFVMFSNAASRLIYPFFENSPTLTKMDFAMYTSINSAGYMFGGLLHYFIDINENNRYKIALFVYMIFVVLDSLFFFMPLPIMCLFGFILGIAGMNSANIRISAVAAYVDTSYLGKLNSLFLVMTTLASSVGQLIVGILAETFPYEYIMVLFQGFYLFAILFFMLPKKYEIKGLYNYKIE